MKENSTLRKKSPRVSSPNLEFSSQQHSPKNKINQTKISQKVRVTEKRESVRRKKKQNNQDSPSTHKKEIFTSLVVITFTAFCFGGLGFGYTLRYAQKWQSLMGKNSLPFSNFVNNQESIKQEKTPNKTIDFSLPNNFN